MNYIQGDKFKSLADYHYAPNVKSAEDYDQLQNTLNIDQLKENDIVYTHTMYVKSLFEEIKDVKVPIIVISHNSDTNVDRSFTIPLCVKKWFTQNVNCSDCFIESIPIGIENDRWLTKWGKLNAMESILKQERMNKNLLYINHNINTNVKERIKPYNLFTGKPWTTLEHGKNGIGYESYISNLRNHTFVICPQGNGIDTHRTWEALYMGSIPIEIRNKNNQYYTDLPICFVDRWEDIDETFLAHEFHRISNETYDMNVLNFDYWKNKILSYKN